MLYSVPSSSYAVHCLGVSTLLCTAGNTVGVGTRWCCGGVNTPWWRWYLVSVGQGVAVLAHTYLCIIHTVTCTSGSTVSRTVPNVHAYGIHYTPSGGQDSRWRDGVREVVSTTRGAEGHAAACRKQGGVLLPLTLHDLQYLGT